MINFDIAAVPFSRYGSYLAISQLPQRDARVAGIYLRTMHGDAPNREICRFEIVGTNAIQIDASPALLRLSAGDGYVEICFSSPDALHIRSRGVALRLVFTHGEYDQVIVRNGGWQINSFSNRIVCALLPLRGTLTMDAPWCIERAEHIVAECRDDVEFLLGECRDSWPQHWLNTKASFAQHRQNVADEFKGWLNKTPQIPARYRAARELAAYIQWSAAVAPNGLLMRPTMLMSKNWLTAVWSWDHCFNAMALSYGNAELAWQQLLLPFDFQRANGALPDCVNDTNLIWNFCKPPIQGWALRWLMKRNRLDGAQLKEIYAPLSRWTEWWLRECADNRDGLPQYNHGNDSGWDNSTLFDGGMPIATPDLSAFLIVQMQTLADIAHQLQKPRAAKQWQRRADELLQRTLVTYWRDDHFVAMRECEPVASQTLLLLMPIVLAQQLPVAVRKILVATIQQQFLTAHGLASESPHSPHYVSDGYWRGPIWAPATLLTVDALVAIGEHQLAATIAERFCVLAQHSGMAENYEALTGAPLRDRAHTWSASVFLILAHEYLPR